MFRGSADLDGVLLTPTEIEDSKPLTTPSKHRSITSGTETKHQPALSAETNSRPTRSTEQLLHASPPRLMHSLTGPGALLDCLTITQMATTNAVVCYRELGLGEEQRNKTTVQVDPARHSQPGRTLQRSRSRGTHRPRARTVRRHRSFASHSSLHPPSYIPVENFDITADGRLWEKLKKLPPSQTVDRETSSEICNEFSLPLLSPWKRRRRWKSVAFADV